MNENIKLKAGNILHLGTWYIPLEHWAIVSDKNTILENKINHGVIETTFDDFFGRYQFFKVKSIHSLSQSEAEKAIARARSIIGKKYDLIHFNCEHFIDFILNRELVSEQVLAANRLLWGLGIGTIGTAIFFNRTKILNFLRKW